MGARMSTHTSTIRTASLAALAFGTGALLLAGCTAAPTAPVDAGPATTDAAPGDAMTMPMGQGSHTHGSRHTLYGSLAALAEDSVEIVSGTVIAQRDVTDLGPSTPFTVSTVRVTTVAKDDGGDLAAGSTVDVRQIGTAAQSGPAPMLQAGSAYLLYLRPTRLPGDAATQSYVTGGGAGIFAAADDRAPTTGADPDAEADAPAFTRVDHEEGDDLPERVSPDQARG
ncbi:hypothetical protein ACAD35_02371 [Clavibacter nebraskensis]